MTFEETERNQVKRIPNRGHYDREAIYRVLDAEIYLSATEHLLLSLLGGSDG